MEKKLLGRKTWLIKLCMDSRSLRRALLLQQFLLGVRVSKTIRVQCFGHLKGIERHTAEEGASGADKEP